MLFVPDVGHFLFAKPVARRVSSTTELHAQMPQRPEKTRRARYEDKIILAPTTPSKKDAHDSLHTGCPTEPPHNWDPVIEYLIRPISSHYLTEPQKLWLHRKPQISPEHIEDALPVITLPLSRTETDSAIAVRVIDDEKHPAYGQRGLFATRDLVPGELIVPYIGYVHSSTASEHAVRAAHLNALSVDRPNIEQDFDSAPTAVNEDAQTHNGLASPPDHFQIGTWDSSSYDLNLYRDEHIELAIDASQMGNEARFCNDYRGVPASDLSSQTSKQWDRKAKRGAKTWSAGGAGSENATAAAGGVVPMAIPMAIPNAEFRDVWFEWMPEHKVEPPEYSNATGVTEDDMKKLDLEDKVSKTNSSRRQRRKKNAGLRGVAIFVMPAGKSGKRKRGIQAGQEVLVSYGKGFWSHHGIAPSTLPENDLHHGEVVG